MAIFVNQYQANYNANPYKWYTQPIQCQMGKVTRSRPQPCLIGLNISTRAFLTIIRAKLKAKARSK